MPTQEQLVSAVLALPSASRARLAEKLLESLDSPGQHTVDALWAAEAEDRLDAFLNGSMPVRPGKSVLTSLQKEEIDGV